MFRKVLLFPFQMAGRIIAGSVRLAVRFMLGLLRVCGSGLRGATLMAMIVTLFHFGICVLTGQPNLPYQILLSAMLGATVGSICGVYRAWTRPKAMPTPLVFQPGHAQRLRRIGKGALRWAAMAPVLLLFVTALTCAIGLEVLSNNSAAADANPPPASRSDLSIMGPSHPALTLAGAEEFGTGGFRLEARPVLLASLAKLYADPRFSELPVARAVFQNTGALPVTDYRVRFRLTGYAADWSPWSDAAQVAPQQTVTTPYFPILDEARLGQLEGFALTDLEVEHEYRQDDGASFQHREIRRVKVMARNWMASFHSIPEDQAEAMVKDPASPLWRDAYATMPLLLPAFVTKDDPVIQQVAGWVSGQAGGAPDDDAGARRFMKALYEFMVANGIRYQLPTIGDRDGWIVQHVHYGRDVLRNRAGCCIDLTIFYASVCEAVHLEPVLVLVPGHIFPAIRMPESKELVPVEVTLVNTSRPQDGVDYLINGYAAAVTVGLMELEQFRKGAHFEVDIAAQRKAGIQGLQLPPLPAGVLATWGIHALVPGPLWQGLAYWAALIGGVFLVQRLWKQRRLALQLANDNPAIRFQGVAALALMRGRWSNRMLRRVLNDSNEDVRQTAEAVLQARGKVAPIQVGVETWPTGLPSLGASGRALRALAAGEFDTLVLSRRGAEGHVAAS